MAAQLSDDGTMDTVIRCSECGEEQRYNFDPAYLVDEGDTENEMSDDYDAFVDWCLEDFESEHECPKRMKEGNRA